jgi:hypothetical protein
MRGCSIVLLQSVQQPECPPGFVASGCECGNSLSELYSEWHAGISQSHFVSDAAKKEEPIPDRAAAPGRSVLEPNPGEGRTRTNGWKKHREPE